MKMYKKSDLTIVNGLLVAPSGDIVVPDAKVIKQANELDTLVQKAVYLARQPKATPAPSLDGFERNSINSVDDAKFDASTPLLDKKAQESMSIMDELDDLRVVKVANEMIDNFADLIRFVENEHVIDCGNDPTQFDTPVIGSVLDLKREDITNAIAFVCGLENSDDDDEFDDSDVNVIPVPLSKEQMEELVGLLDRIVGDEDKDDSEGSEEE